MLRTSFVLAAFAVVSCAHSAPPASAPAASAPAEPAEVAPPPDPNLQRDAYRQVEHLKLVAGSDPVLPTAAAIKRRGTKFRVSYVMYVEPDGVVSHVEPLQDAPDVNPRIINTLLKWRFDAPKERVREQSGFDFTVGQ